MDQKEKILTRCNSIPVPNLVNYLNEGVVTLDELKAAGLTAETVEDIHKHIAANEALMWRNACRKDSPSVYLEFLKYFPEGTYSEQCRQQLSDKEDSWWQDISLTPTEESLRDYLEIFPYGKYAGTARALLDDMPWLETCKANTEAAYLAY